MLSSWFEHAPFEQTNSEINIGRKQRNFPAEKITPAVDIQRLLNG